MTAARRSNLGGASPVGAQAVMSDIGPSITFEDSSTWLRSGTLAASAGVPRLAAISAYQVIGKPVTAPPANALLQIATDGAGTYVATCSTQTDKIWRSTDSGVTWFTVTVSAGATLGGVVYTGARFIVAGSPAGGGFALFYSANGAVWTAGATSATNLLGGPLYADAIRGAWAGGKAVFLVPANQGSYGQMACLTTVDGTAITLFNAGIAMGVGAIDTHMGIAPILLSNGAGGVLAVNRSSLGFSSYLWSADSATSWASYSAPAGGAIVGAAVAGTKIAFALTSFSGTAGSLFVRTAPNTDFSTVVCAATNLSAVFSNGAKFFGFCATTQTISELAADHLSVAATRGVISATVPQASGDRLFLFSASGNYYADKDWSAYDYAGLPINTRVASGAASHLYVRAK